MLPADASIEAEYLRAKLLIAKKQPKIAREALKKVIASGGRGSAARAKLAEIELRLDKNEMAPQDAIDQLERLRFAWRGDDFELNLLDRLGRLYTATGDYRTGLNTLRQAVTYFDKTPRTRKLSDLMTNAFRDLFLDGKADAMPPLEALSLYYDFRELTPLGADGDNMIRRLADRLVSVDLLERAAALLEHQVRYRLEGVAQADVAVRLAMIYLLDHKPEKALAVIRATRQTIMPGDVEARRRRLEARALIDLARYEEAECCWRVTVRGTPTSCAPTCSGAPGAGRRWWPTPRSCWAAAGSKRSRSPMTNAVRYYGSPSLCRWRKMPKGYEACANATPGQWRTGPTPPLSASSPPSRTPQPRK
jgi:hypothetical protein